MAAQEIDSVIARLARDRAFRQKYCQDPDRALEAYLSPEEIRAIKTGDGLSLQRMGAGKGWDEFTQELCTQSPAD